MLLPRESGEVFICVISSLKPSSFLNKSIYMDTLKLPALTGMINPPLIERDDKI